MKWILLFSLSTLLHVLCILEWCKLPTLPTHNSITTPFQVMWITPSQDIPETTPTMPDALEHTQAIMQDLFDTSTS